MRLSLLASACTGAVLSTLLTLPLLAQPAPHITRLVVVGKGKNRVQVRCQDAKDLSQCMDGVQGLSPKEKDQLKGLLPELKQEMKKAESLSKGRSDECFALRVYEFPKGFPEKGAKPRAKVSDCTSAAMVKEKPLVLRAKKGKAEQKP